MLAFLFGLALLGYGAAYVVFALRRGRRAQGWTLAAGVVVCLALLFGALG